MKLCYADPETRAIADLVRLDGYTNGATGGYLITRINVPKVHRGQGRARALLAEIVKDADAERATLVLEVVPSGGLDRGQLVAWYERHGFVRVTDWLMTREPQ